NNAATDVLTITTSSNYAGTTNVGGTTAGSSVTMKGGAVNAFGPTASLSVFTGSVLDLGGNAQNIGSLSGAGTVTNSGALGVFLTNGGNNASTTFGGVIQDGAGEVGLTQ